MAHLTGEEVAHLTGEEVHGSVDRGGSVSVDVFLLAEHYSLHAFEKVLGSNPSPLKEGALT